MTDNELPSIRDLRRAWKPAKLRLAEQGDSDSTSIRFHRACSWLDEAQKLDQKKQIDLVLVQQWISFNSLYGTWNEESRSPDPDRASWRTFVRRLVQLDSAGHLRATLLSHKRLVLTILRNGYLNKHYWETDEASVNNFENAGNIALLWYQEKRWVPILEQLLDRIYFLRCQVIHGAATFGSKLNRKPMEHCTRMLELLLSAVLLTWVDHAEHEDWGGMCYPPSTSK